MMNPAGRHKQLLLDCTSSTTEWQRYGLQRKRVSTVRRIYQCNTHSTIGLDYNTQYSVGCSIERWMEMDVLACGVTRTDREMEGSRLSFGE